MKSFVFMCLTIAGMLAGLYVGFTSAPEVSGYVQTPLTVQRAERAKHLILFTLGGAAAGAGFGWVACHVEKLSPKG